MPAVTVIIPMYNAQRYIRDAVESVLLQTFKDFEIIIIDDASSDDSLAIAVELSKGRDNIKVICHPFNKGVSAARNTGIVKANGNYCAFLDADDMWRPTKLESHLEIMNADLGIGFTYDCSSLIDESGKLLGICQIPSKFDNIDVEYMLLRNPVGNGSTPVILTEALKALRFNEALHHSEDLEFWVRFLLQTNMRICGIRKLLTLYRIREKSASSNTNKHIEGFAEVLEAIRNYAPELIKRKGLLAYAYQLRHVARRAAKHAQPVTGLKYLVKSIVTNPKLVIQEPLRTLSTLIVCIVMLPVSKRYYNKVFNLYFSITKMQIPNSFYAKTLTPPANLLHPQTRQRLFKRKRNSLFNE